MSDVSVLGIVVSSTPIGEYDRRLEILTDEYGRISAFARGARKPSSVLVAASRVFAFGRFELFQGKNSYTVKGAGISDYFIDLSTDMDCMYYGFYFLEVVRYFSRENVEAKEMLKLVYVSLKALENKNIPNILVRCVFELKMMVICGICPAIEKLIYPESRFSLGHKLLNDTEFTLNYVINTPPEKLYSFNLSEEVFSEFSDLVEHLMQLNVDKKFKSLEFLS